MREKSPDDLSLEQMSFADKAMDSLLQRCEYGKKLPTLWPVVSDPLVASLHKNTDRLAAVAGAKANGKVWYDNLAPDADIFEHFKTNLKTANHSKITDASEKVP